MLDIYILKNLFNSKCINVCGYLACSFYINKLHLDNVII